jgi:hypothetical protein
MYCMSTTIKSAVSGARADWRMMDISSEHISSRSEAANGEGVGH